MVLSPMWTYSQQTWDIDPLLVWCWASVVVGQYLVFVRQLFAIYIYICMSYEYGDFSGIFVPILFHRFSKWCSKWEVPNQFHSLLFSRQNTDISTQFTIDTRFHYNVSFNSHLPIWNNFNIFAGLYGRPQQTRHVDHVDPMLVYYCTTVCVSPTVCQRNGWISP